MRTIADKIKSILESKNAIKEKFNLSDDLPFSQYADNIQAGTPEGDQEACDLNAELDVLDDELSIISGKIIEVDNAEPIEDINVELDALNDELSEIRGE